MVKAKDGIMKKIVIILTIILAILFANRVVYAEHIKPIKKHTSPVFYGNVYVWDSNAPFLWRVISAVKGKNAWLELQNKTTALTNKGEVMNIRITAPIKYSQIRIYYKEHIYTFKLKPYLLGSNFILFTFTGGG